MVTATIETVTEANGKYGMEKISAVTMADGTQTKVYTKPAAKSIYEALKAGLQVQLTPKSGGAGYLIASIIGEAAAATAASSSPAPASHNGQAPARMNAEETRQAQGDYIKSKAGQYFYAYSCLKDFFDNEKNGILVTEETLRAGAATIIISLDREGPK
jgi:hypothetical protein